MKKRRKEISEKLKSEAKEQQERKAKKLQTLKVCDCFSIYYWAKLIV